MQCHSPLCVPLSHSNRNAAWQAGAASDAEEAAKLQQVKDARAAAKAAREEHVAKLKEEMKAQVAARTEKDFSVETEGSLLKRRQGLLARMENSKAFIMVRSCVRVRASGVGFLPCGMV